MDDGSGARRMAESGLQSVNHPPREAARAHDSVTHDRPPMIDKLEMLPALAREQHFGRAAEACGVTQPILSAELKQLEETFGLLLVHRQSRFLGFTPEGERVLNWGAPHRWRRPCDASGDPCAQAGAGRTPAPRRGAHRAAARSKRWRRNEGV